MKNVLIVLLVVIVVVLCGVGAYLTSVYNNMVTADNDVKNKQAQVEVVLQRRFDLIPNLVNSTKGVLTQEQKIFTEIAEARTRYAGATDGSEDKVTAANDLESSLSRLLVIVENYPDLKSNQTVQDLMTELSGTENRIAVERQRYNDAATSFNTLINTFPNNLFANLFGFKSKTLFNAVSGADTAPVVDLQN